MCLDCFLQRPLRRVAVLGEQVTLSTAEDLHLVVAIVVKFNDHDSVPHLLGHNVCLRVDLLDKFRRRVALLNATVSVGAKLHYVLSHVSPPHVPVVNVILWAQVKSGPCILITPQDALGGADCEVVLNGTRISL